MYLFMPLLAVLLAIQTGGAEECGSERMRRCKSDGLHDSNAQDGCTSLRSNFDCLLWQTSMCLRQDQQDENKDAILKMWRHLQSFCEADGGWYTRPCFQRTEVKRCESLLPSRGSSTDYNSCRSYVGFRECVSSAAAACASSDRKLLGTYLMDKGQQRAWNCPKDSLDSAPSPLASQSAYGDQCGSEWREEMRVCGRRFEDSEKDARAHNDSDMRHHDTCCALVHYERCVESGTPERDRDRCRSRDLVDEMKARYPYYDCADHTANECSASSTFAASIILLLALLIIAIRLH